MSLSFWIAATAFSIRISADSTVLALLRAGDEKAFRKLIDRHHGSMVGLAQTIVKSRALAEDVAQDTWIAVFNNIASFDGRSALSTWIIGILLNRAKTCAKREARYTAFAEERGSEDEEPAVAQDRFAADGHWSDPPVSFDGMTPERICAGRQLWQHVAEAIEHLPPAQKAVIIMRDVEGRDADETCAALELTVEHQRVLLHRARNSVRNLMENLARNSDARSITKA
jgi:RNA polymerase sigma-70 factor (ECF subfamily)